MLAICWRKSANGLTLLALTEQLLRHSLPLLTEFECMDFDSGAQPRLVVRSVAHYRLVWDVAKSRR